MQKRAPFQEIDVMINSPMPFEACYAKRRTLRTAGVRVPVLSVDDLIQFKQHAGRLQDVSDVEALQRLKEIQGDEKGK